MAKQQTSSTIFFIFGIPAVIRACVLWNEQPRTGWFYVSAISGVMLLTMGVISIWLQRRARAAASDVAAGTGPADPRA